MERDKNSARFGVLEVLDKTGADAASKGARNAANFLFDVSRKLSAKWWPRRIEDPKAESVADAHIP